MVSRKRRAPYSHSSHRNKNTLKNPCHYSKIDTLNSETPSLFHPKVEKLKRLVNCVIRSDEVLGHYLSHVNTHPKHSTAPPLQLYRKLKPDDPQYIGPPEGFMHGLYYDLTHWHYVFHGHSIDSYSQKHQIQDSDNFCSTFALMYLLETHHLRPHFPLRKRAYYHNIRVACQFWIHELETYPSVRTIFEKRIHAVQKYTEIDSLKDAIHLLLWGTHHAEEFYPPIEIHHGKKGRVIEK